MANQKYWGRIHVAPIKIGSIFYPCSFLVLDSPNMEFLFGLDMLRKHQCIIDLKENVLRVGGGEVSVPFLQEKDIPPRFFDEEKHSKEASSSGGPLQITSGSNNPPQSISNDTLARLIGFIHSLKQEKQQRLQKVTFSSLDEILQKVTSIFGQRGSFSGCCFSERNYPSLSCCA